MKLYDFTLEASGGPSDYIVSASAEKTNPQGTHFVINITGQDYSLKGAETQLLSSPGKVQWSILKKEIKSSLTARIMRQESQACRYITVGGIPKIEAMVGVWKGKWEIVDFKKNNNRLLDPLMIEILEELKGKKFDLELTLKLKDDKTLESSINIQDMDPEDDVTFNNFQTDMKYDEGSISGTFSDKDFTYFLNGNAEYINDGMSLKGNWNAVQGEEGTQIRWELTKK